MDVGIHKTGNQELSAIRWRRVCYFHDFAIAYCHRCRPDRACDDVDSVGRNGRGIAFIRSVRYRSVDHWRKSRKTLQVSGQYVFDNFDAAVIQFELPIGMNRAFVETGQFFDLLATGSNDQASHARPGNESDTSRQGRPLTTS